MSKYTWILSPGHEGLSPGGLYLRKGKQSPEVPPGIYEGVFNRQISQAVWYFGAHIGGLEILDIAQGPINIPLKNRIEYPDVA